MLSKLFLFASGEPSLLEELWDYLEGKYFSIDPGQYEYINVGSDAIISLQKIVIGIVIGIIVAAAIVCYDKNRLGAFVRAIIREQALRPDKAMTLHDLGFARNGGVKASLRSRNNLGRVVKCVEKEEYEREVAAAREAYIAEHGNEEGFHRPEYRINFNTDRFYIPDEEHYRVDLHYDKQGSGWRAFILVIIVAIVSAVLLCFLLPDMLQLVDNLMGILSEDDRVLH